MIFTYKNGANCVILVKEVLGSTSSLATGPFTDSQSDTSLRVVKPQNSCRWKLLSNHFNNCAGGLVTKSVLKCICIRSNLKRHIWMEAIQIDIFANVQSYVASLPVRLHTHSKEYATWLSCSSDNKPYCNVSFSVNNFCDASSINFVASCYGQLNISANVNDSGIKQKMAILVLPI